MPYNSTDSAPRQDISTLLMEAVEQEKEYIAQRIWPVYTSTTEIGRYPKLRIGKGDLLRASAGNTKRNITGGYNETESTFEWDNYQTEEYGSEERIDDKTRRQMENFFDCEMVTSKHVMNKLMLDYELQARDATFDTGTFTTTAATVAYTEDNLETIDVPYDVNAAFEAQALVGEVPDTMLISLKLWNRIRRSKKLQLYIYGYLNVSQGGSQITPQMFAQVFMLKDIIIARKSYDVSKQGTNPVVKPVWGTDFISLLKPGEGDFMNGGMGRTVVWDADSPGGLFTTESYRTEQRRGDMIRVRSNRVLKTINPLAARLIQTNANDA